MPSNHLRIRFDVVLPVEGEDVPAMLDQAKAKFLRHLEDGIIHPSSIVEMKEVGYHQGYHLITDDGGRFHVPAPKRDYSRWAGILDEDLDDLVHDSFSERAASVNNGGREEQIDFLLDQCGCSPEWLDQWIADPKVAS